MRQRLIPYAGKDTHEAPLEYIRRGRNVPAEPVLNYWIAGKTIEQIRHALVVDGYRLLTYDGIHRVINRARKRGDPRAVYRRGRPKND